ncbi:MAG TPA: hypothetical protein VK971_00930 [Thiohalobacter sp.]|nr:hypothetical protein [Thiohalobacter sp.]
MTGSIADVMIHVDENLAREELERLEGVVKANACVTSADVPEHQQHMMLVTYNPECVSAREILSLVTAQGVHAELVGM